MGGAYPGGHGSGNAHLSMSGMSQMSVSGGAQELLLPDGTDYASFRRALLREGGIYPICLSCHTAELSLAFAHCRLSVSVSVSVLVFCERASESERESVCMRIVELCREEPFVF
jgi:hypothetical protein